MPNTRSGSKKDAAECADDAELLDTQITVEARSEMFGLVYISLDYYLIPSRGSDQSSLNEHAPE